MLLDHDHHDTPASHEADICIVGGGIAGLTVAQALVGRGQRVIVLEGGGLAESAEAQALNRVEIAGLPHGGVESARFRMLGGNAARWGGQLMPLMPSDLAVRAAVPGSGWPLGASALCAYEKKVEDLAHVHHGAFRLDRNSDARGLLGELDPARFEVWASKWSPWRYRNLTATLGRRCRESSDIRILLHANAVGIDVSADGRRVEAIRFRSLRGREGRVTARTYVLGCGAIETARLLLASRVGNEHDCVGRYFQDHLSYPVAAISGLAPPELRDAFEPTFDGATMRSPKVALSESERERHAVLGAIAHVVFVPDEASGFSELRRMLQRLQGGELPLPTPAGALLMLRDAPDLARLAWGRLAGSRLRFPRRALARILVECEQAPNRDSRVSLGEARDALGLPVARLEWRVTELERRTVRTMAAALRGAWHDRLQGRIAWDESIDRDDDGWLARISDTYHQAGTARMSDDPRRGVVDRDLRVHGMANLHVTGCAVFPTSGATNPTFTMMALCLRLAGHLAENPPR